MKIEHIRALNQWEIKRDSRVMKEVQFGDLSGLINVVELHVPYTKYDFINIMLDRADKFKGRRTLVCNGDSMNLDMFSRFWSRSTTRSKPSEELGLFMSMLKSMSDVYKDIIVTQTNHESRMSKVIMDNFKDKGVAEEVVKGMLTLQDYFDKNNLDNVSLIDHYLFQIGDAVCAHLEVNSTIPARVDSNIIQYLAPRIYKNWNLCFQSHTHAQSMVSVDRKTVIETGVMADSFDYWRDGKTKGRGKLGSLGYAECIMEEGKTYMNSARYNILGWEGYL